MSAIRPVDIIPPRPKLTKAQRVKCFDANHGVCHLCRLSIKHGEKWEAEHPKARGRGGSDKIENLKPAHVDCHKPKTAVDVAVMAKTTRSRAKHIGARPPAHTGLEGRSRDDKQAVRAERTAGRIGLPPRRSIYGDVT